jgi:hypothetical protein
MLECVLVGGSRGDGDAEARATVGRLATLCGSRLGLFAIPIMNVFVLEQTQINPPPVPPPERLDRAVSPSPSTMPPLPVARDESPDTGEHWSRASREDRMS